MLLCSFSIYWYTSCLRGGLGVGGGGVPATSIHYLLNRKNYNVSDIIVKYLIHTKKSYLWYFFFMVDLLKTENTIIFIFSYLLILSLLYVRYKTSDVNYNLDLTSTELTH